MQSMRKNVKTIVFLYLLLCFAPLCYAATKPSYLSGAGDAEQKANNFITSAISWASSISIGFGTLGFAVGGIMLVPVLGQQQRAKYFFLGGAGAIAAGVAGLSLASWLYEKMM